MNYGSGGWRSSGNERRYYVVKRGVKGEQWGRDEIRGEGKELRVKGG